MGKSKHTRGQAAIPKPSKSLKTLKICPDCAGYMIKEQSFTHQAQPRNWKDETFHRSFGGIEMRQFRCEKCQHTEIYQVDPFTFLDEDTHAA